MFDKIKEKIKKWWGKFLIIIGIGAITVLAFGNSVPQFSQLLKVPKENILWSNEYTEYKYENGEIISQKQIVSYAYKSDEIVLPFANEIIEKRTENIVTRNLGGNKRLAQSGYNFYQEDGDWKQVKFATTTPEVFNKVSWIKGVLALDTGATSPGTTANDATIGTLAWAVTDRAKVKDGLNTYAGWGSNGTTNYLKLTNFGFAIPPGDIIDGILVEFAHGWSGGDEVYDNEIKIVKSDGSIGTTNKSTGAQLSFGSGSYTSYGSSSDLWGEDWGSSDINNSNFGVVLSILKVSGEVVLDHVRITVYYTEEAPPVEEEEIKPIPLGLF